MQLLRMCRGGPNPYQKQDESMGVELSGTLLPVPLPCSLWMLLSDLFSITSLRLCVMHYTSHIPLSRSTLFQQRRAVS